MYKNTENDKIRLAAARLMGWTDLVVVPHGRYPLSTSGIYGFSPHPDKWGDRQWDQVPESILPPPEGNENEKDVTGKKKKEVGTGESKEESLG